MTVHGIELKPGMILSDDKNNRAIVIPHKKYGVAFVSYSQSGSWSERLDTILTGELKEIRDIPEGSSLVDGKLLWKASKYRINGSPIMDEQEFLDAIRTFKGNALVEVI